MHAKITTSNGGFRHTHIGLFDFDKTNVWLVLFHYKIQVVSKESALKIIVNLLNWTTGP